VDEGHRLDPQSRVEEPDAPPAGVSPSDEPALHPDGPWPPRAEQSAGAQGDLEGDEEAGENRPGPCPPAPGVTGQELGTDRVDAAPGRAGAWAYGRGSGVVAQSAEAGPRADHRWQARGQLAENLEPLRRGCAGSSEGKGRSGG